MLSTIMHVDVLKITATRHQSVKMEELVRAASMDTSASVAAISLADIVLLLDILVRVVINDSCVRGG